MHKQYCLLVCFILLLIGCGSNEDLEPTSISIDFSDATHGFKSIFSEYYPSRPAVSNEAIYQLSARHQPLPSPFQEESGWYLKGMNFSEDLFMSIKRYSSGWEPETHYDVSLSVTILSNVGSNCSGNDTDIAPGEEIYVKLGVSSEEPINVVSDTYEDAIYRTNIDKGDYTESGVNADVVGNIANGRDCQLPATYQLKTLSMKNSINVKSDENGGFWLTVGSDSIYPGFTEYYIMSVDMTVNGTLIEYNFAENDASFSPLFSDYPPSTEAYNGEKEFQLKASHTQLPSPIEANRGWLLSGSNHSRDLFMGVTGYVQGFKPNTSVNVLIDSTFLSRTPENCNDHDFTPGEQVYVKHAASAHEPQNGVVAYLDYQIYELSIDIGKLEQNGVDSVTAGNLATTAACSRSPEWTELRRNSLQALELKTDNNGGIWLTVGVDSMSLGVSEVYVKDLVVREIQ
ncbi:hypothetical protein PN836_006445 [Ningiella sp. W23]|uniref:hypothetical protein n=1 Tax=Ningiella sp. W23 TaxID=3023715 RepID=UPI003756D888